MTHSRPTIHDLLQRGGLAPRRDLGQNFVADPNTVRRIAELADVAAGDRVVEIGAGLGSLTLALADTGAEVIAVEVDRGIVPLLREVVADRSNVTVIEADAMTTDWEQLLGTQGTGQRHNDSGDGDGDDGEPDRDRSWTLVANLPYNVATPLVCDLLDDVPEIESMLVMVQKEVAQRFAAPPGSKQYGAVSVKIAYWGTAKVVATVPASVFVPRPNVESAIVRIDRRTPPAVDAGTLFGLVRQAFGQRRKMLRRSLSGAVTHQHFETASISDQARPEQLGIDEWVRLANVVANVATGIVDDGDGDARDARV